MTDEASDLELPEITYPLVLDTVGKLLATKHRITAYCGNPACWHSGDVNLAAIARQCGVDYPSDRSSLLRLLRCSACGGRCGSVALAAPSAPAQS